MAIVDDEPALERDTWQEQALRVTNASDGAAGERRSRSALAVTVAVALVVLAWAAAITEFVIWLAR